MPSETLPLPLVERLDALAVRLDRPRSAIVEDALEAWLAREERHHLMTLEALAQVDAGLTIDHAEIEAWIAGLDGEATPAG